MERVLPETLWTASERMVMCNEQVHGSRFCAV